VRADSEEGAAALEAYGLVRDLLEGFDLNAMEAAPAAGGGAVMRARALARRVCARVPAGFACARYRSGREDQASARVQTRPVVSPDWVLRSNGTVSLQFVYGCPVCRRSHGLAWFRVRDRHVILAAAAALTPAERTAGRAAAGRGGQWMQR